MAMSPQDIMNTINRELLMANTTVNEQIEFISEQIKNPFDGGSSNYFKKLKNSVKSPELKEICLDLFEQIENMYPAIAVMMKTQILSVLLMQFINSLSARFKI